MANLLKYEDATVIGTATVEQILASQEAAKRDGGSGVIVVDGVSCYADATVQYRVRVWDEGANFRDLVTNDKRVTDKLSREELDELFDVNKQLRNVDKIFNRVFAE